jgi:hypothetical protein
MTPGLMLLCLHQILLYAFVTQIARNPNWLPLTFFVARSIGPMGKESTPPTLDSVNPLVCLYVLRYGVTIESQGVTLGENFIFQDMNVYAAKDDQSTWQGWDFGDLVEFDYNEQLAMSPTGSKGEDETSTTTADTVRRFTQVFKGGDKGYPCHTPAGRTAFAHLYCHDGTTATCVNLARLFCFSFPRHLS